MSLYSLQNEVKVIEKVDQTSIETSDLFHISSFSSLSQSEICVRRHHVQFNQLIADKLIFVKHTSAVFNKQLGLGVTNI